ATAERESGGRFHQPSKGCPISRFIAGIHVIDQGVDVASGRNLEVRALSEALTDGWLQRPIGLSNRLSNNSSALGASDASRS
ncbi:MAG: hypothetical protein LC721_12715, partial [Actinobacteria bacterium]|nr:hypothetical protein [Actinomycetota bacterium]